jgi:peptidoglycan/LPS O-acetylase OafA/YrhL
LRRFFAFLCARIDFSPRTWEFRVISRLVPRLFLIGTSQFANAQIGLEMNEKSKIDPKHSSTRALWMFLAGLIVATVGATVLARAHFLEPSDAEWYILIGLPALGIGVAACLRALSKRRIVRILAGLVVASAGLILTAFGMINHLLEPDFHPNFYNDSRPWCVCMGLGLLVAGLGFAWFRDDG